MQEAPQSLDISLDSLPTQANSDQVESRPLLGDKSINYGATVLVINSTESPPHIIPPVMNRLEHWLMRDSTFKHLLDWLFRVSPLPNRRFWLQGPSIPVLPQNISRALFTTQFSQEFYFVINTVWPLVLAGLITHDLILYDQKPEERFGNTWEKIFLGQSTNQITWSSEYGTDYVTYYQNWLPLSVIFAAPIMGGFMRWLSRISWRHSLTEQLLALNITISDQIKLQQLFKEVSSWQIVRPGEVRITFREESVAKKFQVLLRQIGLQNINLLTLSSSSANSSQYVLDLKSEYYESLHSLSNFDTNSKVASSLQNLENSAGNNNSINNNNNQTKEPADDIIIQKNTASSNQLAILDAQHTTHLAIYFKQHPRRINWSIHWDGLLRDESRLKLTQTIARIAQQDIGLFKSGSTGIIPLPLYAMHCLAQIADSFKRPDVIRAGRNNQVINQAQQETLTVLNVLASGQNTAGHRISLLHYLYANYLLWTLGRARGAAWHAGFIFVEMIRRGLVGYTAFRFLQSLAKKFSDLADYTHDKESCENSERIWSLISSIADYGCQTCDWPYSNYANSLDAQSCLDGLLSQPRTANTILQALPQLIKHPNNIASIDLSKQDWPHWTEDEWETFLNEISALQGLEILNLSRTTLNPVWLEDNKIPLLVDFLDNFYVAHFDIHNQNIGAEQINLLIPSLVRVGTVSINISGNNIGDSGAETLSQSLPGSDIRELDLSNNNVSDYGVEKIAPPLGNSTITKISVAQNLLTGLSLDAIGEVLENSQLSEIDCSNPPPGHCEIIFTENRYHI